MPCINSITKRWVRGSLFFTLAVLLIAETIFLYFTFTSYYSGVRVAIDNQFNTLRTQLSFAEEAPKEEKAVLLRRTVEQFDEKARFELMLLNAQGQIAVTSSGLPPVSQEVPADVKSALALGAGRGEFVGTNETGEKVMAVTVLTPYASDDIVAMRLVTSLEQVDKSLLNTVIASVVLLCVVILASVISGVYFIRSIVLPLRKVEATAARIARGDLDTRIQNEAGDEIGNLCRTINHMAEELSNNERIKNEFISSVSHELRTPLTSIKGWAETVGGISTPDDPNFKRGVEIIAGETDRLYDMVEELLDFSRMQKGLSLKPELLDLAAEVEEAVLLSCRRAESLGIAMMFEPPELPVPVMGDPNRIRQVLVNIIDNAIKYSTVGKQIVLEILISQQNAYVIVRDQGQGIGEEDLENVKQRFYKGRGAARGSGIGLAVVEELMEAHGGGVEITSELGKGTEVTLRFPLYSVLNEK